VPGKHYTIELHLQPLFFLRQDFTLWLRLDLNHNFSAS
jgi:hypothetical protein